MAMDFKLPDLGEGIHEAQVVNVLVKEGDAVKEDQMVLEVETDKAAVELPVPYSGVISKLHVKQGDTVTVGSVLLSVEAGAAAGKTAHAESAAAAPATPARADEAVRAAAPAVAARSAPAESVRRGGDGDHTTVTPPDTAGRGAGRYEGLPAANEVETAEARREGPIPAAPAVRKLAREMNVDLHRIHGTGPGGRVVREDVERAALTRGGAAEARAGGPATTRVPSELRGAGEWASRGAEVAAPPTTRAPAMPGAAAPAAEALPDFAQWGPVRREKVSQIRKTIARQMARSWSIVPHVTHADEADVTDLETFRKEQSAVFTDKGTKLTLTAFLLKATVGALQQYPQVNASYDDASGEIIYKDYYHVGVAVDTPRGLMVPVLRDVDRKGLVRISKELRDLADRAREFKIDIAELRGGTFTLTNVGAMGGTFATPIINYPEVAILGVGKLEWKAVVRNGQIVPRKMLPLFLSFDHRIIDGVTGAHFVRTVISFLENPLNLLLAS